MPIYSLLMLASVGVSSSSFDLFPAPSDPGTQALGLVSRASRRSLNNVLTPEASAQKLSVTAVHILWTKQALRPNRWAG